MANRNILVLILVFVAVFLPSTTHALYYSRESSKISDITTEESIIQAKPTKESLSSLELPSESLEETLIFSFESPDPITPSPVADRTDVEPVPEDWDLEDEDYLADRSFHSINPDFDPDSLSTIYEGDMLFDSDDLRVKLLNRGGMITDKRYYWTEDATTGWPTIYYQIDADVAHNTEVIKKGMEHWMDKTCLVYIEGTTVTPFIRYFNGSGCWSYVGRNWWKEYQHISIGPGCGDRDVVAHEVGHAMGFQHEQSRTDRDNYVNIHFDHITKGKEGNFYKSTTLTDVMYDYTSIMHYGSKDFSKDGNFTITSKSPFTQPLIGQYDGLSFRDTITINQVYKCIDKWKAKCSGPVPDCKNHGYVFKDCKCACPPETEGELCQNVTGAYYKNDGCDEEIKDDATISSPSYPEMEYYKICGFWINPGSCKNMTIRFSDFNVLYRSNNQCYWDYLEIREDDVLRVGKTYCGDELRGKTLTFITTQVFLKWRAHGYDWYNRRGFKAEITMTNSTDCT